MMNAAQIAECAHEMNRLWCVHLHDYSQPKWVSAPDWQKESAVEGVMAILEKPERTPEQSHEGWLAHKEKDGWVYGEVKDPDKKTHPCMVPYDQLPPEQRAKDLLFTRTVKLLIEANKVGED